MIKLIKTISICSTLMLTCFTARAEIISVGGIAWDNGGSSPTFSTNVEFTQWLTDASGITAASLNAHPVLTPIAPTLAAISGLPDGTAELGGVGEFKLGTNPGEAHCASGDPLLSCELTFAFGGFFFDLSTEALVVTETAWINIYYDSTPDFVNPNAGMDATEADDAVDGNLWLSLDIDTFIYTPDAVTSSYGEPLIAGASVLFGDAIGGVAMPNFDVNDSLDFFDALGFGFTSKFISNGEYGTAFGGGGLATPSLYSQTSSGRVDADPIPEPSTLAILGLALLGLVGARRKET